MVSYKESGVELIQARGTEGRFLFRGQSFRLGTFSGPSGWYLGVNTSSGRPYARLSLEFAKSLKEAKDMLKYGFFLRPDENRDLVEHLQRIGLLSIPGLATTKE